MNAQELAEKFAVKVAAAAFEKDRQIDVAAENLEKRTDDADHCKRALSEHVLPFLNELKQCLPNDQFSFAPQIDVHDRRTGASGSSKGIAFAYPPDGEPYISNSGDLTREKIAKLVEMAMAMDNHGG